MIPYFETIYLLKNLCFSFCLSCYATRIIFIFCYYYTWVKSIRVWLFELTTYHTLCWHIVVGFLSYILLVFFMSYFQFIQIFVKLDWTLHFFVHLLIDLSKCVACKHSNIVSHKIVNMYKIKWSKYHNKAHLMYFHLNDILTIC